MLKRHRFHHDPWIWDEWLIAHFMITEVKGTGLYSFKQVSEFHCITFTACAGPTIGRLRIKDVVLVILENNYKLCRYQSNSNEFVMCRSYVLVWSVMQEDLYLLHNRHNSVQYAEEAGGKSTSLRSPLAIKLHSCKFLRFYLMLNNWIV